MMKDDDKSQRQYEYGLQDGGLLHSGVDGVQHPDLRVQESQELVMGLLALLGRRVATPELIRNLAGMVKHVTGFEAVGVRMREGERCTYYEAEGFSDRLHSEERSLFDHSACVEIKEDSASTLALNYLCSAVIGGLTDAALPFFSEGGSFWTNSSPQSLASTAENQLGDLATCRCATAGHESIALVPLRSGNSIIGLLQLGDRRQNCLTPQIISSLETIAASIGIVLANRKQGEEELDPLKAEFQLSVKEGTSSQEETNEKLLMEAEDALKESEELYRLTLSNISDAVFVTDEHGSFTFICPNVHILFGYSDDEVNAFGNIAALLGDNLFAPEDLEAAGEIPNIEREIVDKSGRSHDVLISVKRVFIRGGTLLYSCRDVTERKRVEEALQSSEEKLRIISNAVQDALIVVSDQGEITFWNSAAEHLFGFSDSEVLQKDVREILDLQEIAEVCDTRVGQMLQTDQGGAVGYVREIEARHRDGRTFPIELSLSQFRMKGQWHVVGSARDITARRQAENDLRESELRFRAVFENHHVVMLIIDPRTGAIENASPAACSFYGYSLDGLKRKTIYDINVAEPENILGSMQEAQSSQCEYFVFRHRLANGETRYVEVCSGPIVVEGRELLFSVINDVTDRTRFEEQLKASERRYRLVVENSTDVIWTMDPVSRAFTFFSTSVEQLFGYTVAEASAMPLEDWLPPEWQATALGLLDQVVSGELASCVYEGPVYHKDGSLLWCEIVVSPRKEEKTGIGQLVGVTRDVTERRESERKLLESEANLRTFFDAMPESLFLLKRDGTIIVANKYLAERLGYSPDSLVGLNIFDVMPAVSAEKHRRFLDEVIHEQQVLELEDQHGGRYFRTLAAPVFDSDGVTSRLALYSIDITDQKKMEEALSSSEQRYRTIVDLSPAGIVVHMDGRVTYANKSFVSMIGYSSSSEIVGKSLFTFIHSDYHEVVAARNVAMLESRRPVSNIEEKYVRRNGTLVNVAVSTAPIAFEGHRAILVIVEDITKRKKAVQELRESEERFRQVAESAGDWIWEVDETGLFQYCSSAVEQILGYQPQEVVGQRFFWDLNAAYERAVPGSGPLELFNRKEPFRAFVSTHVRKDGEIVIMEASGSPILDSEGNFFGYRGTNTDITDRVRSEESRELLAAVVEHAAEAIVVTDTDGNVKYVNPAFERISGYTNDEVLGENPRVLKSGKHDDKFYQDLWHTIADGRVWRGNLINKKKGGGLFEEEATISPIRNSSGKIVNYVAVKRDVTKEAQLKKQLIQSQKMEAIGTLAGGIAHDFNNIVFAITGYTELALEDLPAESSARWDLERVLSASRRAGEMVKQILTFSRQGEQERKPLDLIPIVKEGLKFLRASIPSTIEIRQHIEARLGKVNADPTGIHQVLMNLCSNASHAMRDTKGVLTVELTGVTLEPEYSAQHLTVPPGRYVKMVVSDTGHGISPDILQRIFEPYFTTKEVDEGTGLGLAVIHGIVRSHGGAVSVNSEPGQGTTFNVFLPVMEAGTEAEKPAADEPPPTGVECVLVVDDEEILVDMGQAILERLGYEVVTSTDPVDALELFSSDPQRFDLVLTDLTMPKMTGIELALEIGALRPGMPIILCTGFGHKFTEQEAQEAGVQAVIKKPISKKDVAATVRNVLDRKD